MNFAEIYKSIMSGNASNNHDNKRDPLIDFILGIFFIGFAIPMIWMNERKQVVIFEIIEKAKD
jgi:hypothetical protein